jgi:hypothetical protein
MIGRDLQKVYVGKPERKRPLGRIRLVGGYYENGSKDRMG